MSTAPFMQLYVGDYLADTQHLTTEQHGAYLLLLMTMWRHDASLPNDPKKLARIARVSPKRWPAIWADIEGFFEVDGDTIKNQRLTKEHQKAVSISQERKNAGSRGGKAKALKSNNVGLANATDLPKHSQISEPDNIGGGGSAGAREDDLTPREQILAAMGVGPDGVIGPSRFLGSQGDMAEAKLWLEMPGLTLPVICEEIRRICREKTDGPPKSFRYFSQALQRLSGQLTAAPLQPIFGSAPSAAPAKAHTVTFDLSKFDDFGNRLS